MTWTHAEVDGRAAAPAPAPAPAGSAVSRVPLLSLRGIHKRFGAVQALVDVDLDVHSREVVAVVGDNGAGKSTLVDVMAGVIQPDEGEIRIDDRPAVLGTPAVARNLRSDLARGGRTTALPGRWPAVGAGRSGRPGRRGRSR